MTVHIVKLCVGVESIEQLERFQTNRRAHAKARNEPAENIHRTRNRPRRDREVLDGGSLYWIIKGFIRVRQPIVRLDELYDDAEAKRCGFVLGPGLVRTELHARRPKWRRNCGPWGLSKSPQARHPWLPANSAGPHFDN